MKKIVIIIFSIILSGSTAYVLLDTFTFEEHYASVKVSLDGTAPTDYVPSSATGTAVDIKTLREHDTTIHVADIKLGPGQTIQSVLADNTYGKNVTETTSAMANSIHATLATNGDFYGTRREGYVIRNGQLLRSIRASGKQEDLVLWKNGSMSIISEGKYTAQMLLDQGALQVLSFGPGLVIDNKIEVTTHEEVAKAKISNPRTAIGYIGDNHYILVVSDGRTEGNKGLTLYQLAEFMKSQGASQAYNLDGGGSSTMVYQGKVINQPTTDGKTIAERKVSDILYIK